MKFLLINGKLYKRNSDNKIITIPDNYNNEPLKLNGNVLMIGGKVVGNNPKGESVLPKLAAPQNVTADGTTVSWDAVENATSYEIFADGTSLGIVEGAATDELAGTWVFNSNFPNVDSSTTYNVHFTSNSESFSSIRLELVKIYQRVYYGDITVFDSDLGGLLLDEAYKTITITSKLSEVTNGDTLLAWLQANATKQ